MIVSFSDVMRSTILRSIFLKPIPISKCHSDPAVAGEESLMISEVERIARDVSRSLS
jgi:hypothetical protein